MKKIKVFEPARGLKKFSGIMFRRRVGNPLVFTFNSEARFVNAIHSFFCVEFDAIFLDSKRRIVDIKRVKPFRPLVVSSKPCKYLIEAEAGYAKKNGWILGDVVFWK